MNKNDLNPIFVPYDLPIEDIETKGNYQKLIYMKYHIIIFLLII